MLIHEALNRVVGDVENNGVLVALATALALTVLCLSTFGLINAVLWARDWWRAHRLGQPGRLAATASAGEPAPTAIPAVSAQQWAQPLLAVPVDALPAPSAQTWIAGQPDLRGRLSETYVQAAIRVSDKAGDWEAWQDAQDQFALLTFEPDDDDASPD